MLEIQDHGSVRELRLARPPANAINQALVDACMEAMDQAFDDCGAIVISGQPGMFTGGLDIPELIQLDRPGLMAAWTRFLKFLEKIAFSPIPVAFAITGHAPAAGIVIPLFGDFRVMSSGPFKTGINEVRVGLVIPPLLHRAAVRACGHRQAERLVATGALLSAEDAVAAGLVDEAAADPEATIQRAVAWCEQQTRLPAYAAKNARLLARADFREMFAPEDTFDVTPFADDWFREESQRTLRGLVEKLKGG